MVTLPPSQDHYEIARDAAFARLRGRLDSARLEALGARWDDGAARITLPCLCWELHVDTEPFGMRVLPVDRPVRIAWQILALNYLSAEDPSPPGQFVAFADFAEGRGYESAFTGRVCRRLTHTAGRREGQFLEAAQRLGASPAGEDPVRCIFRFFPLFELQVLRYPADEDFPADCTVLLPDNALKLFSMEDAIVAAERLVAALEGKGPAAEPEEEPE